MEICQIWRVETNYALAHNGGTELSERPHIVQVMYISCLKSSEHALFIILIRKASLLQGTVINSYNNWETINFLDLAL